jgi:hypothetical protein
MHAGLAWTLRFCAEARPQCTHVRYFRRGLLIYVDGFYNQKIYDWTTNVWNKRWHWCTLVEWCRNMIKYSRIFVGSFSRKRYRCTVESDYFCINFGRFTPHRDRFFLIFTFWCMRAQTNLVSSQWRQCDFPYWALGYEIVQRPQMYMNFLHVSLDAPTQSTHQM